jgi:N-acetylglucosaminyldiphosphoundecaprenol N-acetyl-beta-D-mannosaminyltransferase
MKTHAMPDCFDLLGVPVRATFPEEVSRLLVKQSERLARPSPPGAAKPSTPGIYICFATVHGIMECREDADLQKIYAEAFLTVPDGMPLVWWARAVGHKRTRRVYGPDFLLHQLAATTPEGARHFFCGGRPGVAVRMAERLQMKFPELCCAGTSCPPFRPWTEEDWQEMAAVISEAKPDYVWVGLGTPKQDLFMAKMAKIVPAVFLGVGAAFDIHAGLQPDAPQWIKNSGLQWVFRLLREPRRLARRYLILNPKFLWQAVKYWWARR